MPELSPRRPDAGRYPGGILVERQHDDSRRATTEGLQLPLEGLARRDGQVIAPEPPTQ
jgi:hypothetical protein